MSESKQHFPDYDARWKILIEVFAEATLERFFPNLAKQRNLSLPIKFIEKELQKLSPDWQKKGWTIGDKLMEVSLVGNKKKLVLIHFDVHKSHDMLFKELMWRRGYRIMDKNMDSDFTAIAIYLSKSVPPDPDRFYYEFEGTEISYKFNAFMIKDQKEEELIASKNPLDIAILAMLYIIKAGNDVDLLSQYKMKVARLCFERNYPKQEIENLLIFVGFTIALPIEREKIFFHKIHNEMEKHGITLRDQNPTVSRLLEKLLTGTTLEERDEERDKEREKELKKELKKEQIIRHHQFGIESEKITLLLNVEKEFVEKTIFEYEQNKAG